MVVSKITYITIYHVPQSNWKRLVRLSSDGAARVPAVAGDIVLYSWA